MNLDRQSDFVRMDQQADKLGFTHYRYYQTLKGILIENSMYVGACEERKALKTQWRNCCRTSMSRMIIHYAGIIICPVSIILPLKSKRPVVYVAGPRG